MDTPRPWTFPLALLFQETLLVAIILACIRLMPSEEALIRSVGVQAYWRQIILMTCIGAAAGAAIGRFSQKSAKGALIGLGISLPAAIAWTLAVFYRHAMVT